MYKKSLLLLGSILLSAMDPLNFFTASATHASIIESPECENTRSRPPFTVRNATGCPLTVTFTPRDKTEDYVWYIAPKDGGQTCCEKKLLEGPNLTEDNRYGTLTVYQWREQEIDEDGCFILKKYAVFGDLVDTSALFSIYPKSACFYSLEQDETSGGTTAPKWLVEDVKKELVEKLAGAPSLLNQALEELRIKWASMTPEEKENPYTVDFPSCLHGLSFNLPLPSHYLLRPAQTEDLRRQLDDFFPTEDEILAAEKAFLAEGIKIYPHGS
ncbi:MAG: hypothetical protein GW748_01675 [Alphaproteobacteria bacterium]|nr:hypothetical protein [Alphaproteobacteria bacterium]NCQ66440.1 hypothetical protein [Alphaproteobacteria bacterium]